MQAFPAGVAHARPPERSRTLVARADTIWIWPGIPLTLKRGAEILPAATETIRFWIARWHGPEALGKDIGFAIACASRRLVLGDEEGAQRALDALGLATLSPDGAALMRAAADHLGVVALDLPLHLGPRTCGAQDIAFHVQLFKLRAEAVLAKGAIPFDTLKHPRWPAGAPDSQGGEFAPADAWDAAITPAATRPRRPKRPPRQLPLDDNLDDLPQRGIGDNSEKYRELPELPEEEPQYGRYGVVQEIAQDLNEALGDTAYLWVRNTLEMVATIAWMNNKATSYYYQLKANLDPPKTLDELQDAVARPTLGYHIHHIVEWEAGLDAGFSEDRLKSRENEVEIPEMKHREITYWYQTPNSEYEVGEKMLSPRQYLEGKSWQERYDLGIKKLRDFGVLE